MFERKAGRVVNCEDLIYAIFSFSATCTTVQLDFTLGVLCSLDL